MANTNLINDVVLPDSFRVLRNNTVLTNAIGPHYDDTYKFKGAKPGESLRLRTPQEFTTRSTLTANMQDVEQKNVTLTQNVIRGIDIQYSDAELAQDVDGFIEYRAAPAMATLAASVDQYIYNTLADSVANAVTLPVTNIDSDDILNAGVALDNNSAPRDQKRMVILPPKGMKQLVSSSASLFNNASSISQQYDDGIVKVPALGFNFGMSQNVSTHTTGGYDANYDVKTVPASGATTLDVDTGTGTIKKGDVFTIADVYEVNKLTKESTGELKKFTVTADSAGGDVNLSITPAIISTGAYQNVDALPVVDADLVFIGTASTAYPQALAFHPDAFAVGFCDLDLPTSGIIKGARMVEDGMSIRCIQWYDGENSVQKMRFDLCFGAVAVIPEHACRIYTP
jgi:hypothetical protein